MNCSNSLRPIRSIQRPQIRNSANGCAKNLWDLVQSGVDRIARKITDAGLMIALVDARSLAFPRCGTRSASKNLSAALSAFLFDRLH